MTTATALLEANLTPSDRLAVSNGGELIIERAAGD